MNKMILSNKKLKYIFSIIISFLLVVSSLSLNSLNKSTVYAEGQEIIKAKLKIDARASMLVDFDSEQILQKQNETEPLPVLSASKLLSVYLIFEQIKTGKLKLEDQIVISNNIAKLSQNTFFSNVPLISGKAYTVKELLSATLVVSANGAVAALAEKIAGSEKNFVDLMRTKSTQLGMKNTFLFTSTGLSTEDISEYGLSIGEIGSNRMSARDGAILSVELLKKFPEVVEFTKQPVITFPETAVNSRPTQYKNVNSMLPKLNDALFYQGVEGLKTGSSEEENSATFFGYYNANGKRLISIVIGAKNKDSRFSETAKLFDFATKTLKFKEIINANSKIQASQLALVRGHEKSIEMTTSSKIGIFTDQENISFTANFQPNKTYYREYNKAFAAPIAKNAELGEITVKIDNVDYLREKDKHYTIKMLSKNDYSESKYAKLQDVQDFISNIFR